MKRNPYSSNINGAAEGLTLLSADLEQTRAGIRQGEPLPTRMRILPWGSTRKGTGGIVTVNEKTAAMLPDMQRQFNWPHAHIDIEHGTIPGTPLFDMAAKAGQFGPVLGWGMPIVIPGEGLYVENITWTPQSKRAYEFPDVSGVVKTLNDADGTVVALHSFAMCCHGKAEGSSAAALSALLDPTNMEESMDKLLLALLGLEETADETMKMERAAKIGAVLKTLLGSESETEAMSALFKAGPEKVKALLALDPQKLTALSQLSTTDLSTKLDLLSQMDAGASAAMTALGKRVGTMETTLQTLSQDTVAARREKILTQAAAKGKAVPEGWLTKYGGNLDVLSDMIDGLPEGVVPLSQLSTDKGHPGAAKASAEEAAVAAKFGRKPEDLKGF